MRGAARIGGKSFRVPDDTRAPESFNPLEALDLVGDLPVAPALVPINDEWSISNFDDPVDMRDCAAYPASPFCENEWLDPFGSPFGFAPEIKSNGCETCLYVYPVILWMKFTPSIICYRDPNCDRPNSRKTPSQEVPEIPEIPSGYYLELYCVRSWVQTTYGAAEKRADFLEGNQYYRDPQEEILRLDGTGQQYGTGAGANTIIVRTARYKLNNVVDDALRHQEVFSAVIPTDRTRKEQKEMVKNALSILFASTTGSDNRAWSHNPSGIFPIGIPPTAFETQPQIDFWADFYWRIKFTLIPIRGGEHFDGKPPKRLPPPPIPPIADGGGDKGKPRRKKDMCCNDCADSKENTDKLLREIKEIKKVLGSGKLERAFNAAVGIGDDSITTIVNLIAKRIGTSSYPIEVPESLLQGIGDKSKKIESNAEFLHWITYQFDGLVGQFPIDVEVKDIDPLKQGDQNKTIQLPNIAESIAEMYGLILKSSVNQEVELNMLLRLAAEAIATKNAAVVTQDYARANAQFLGYKANFKPRELQYNFDFTNANLDPRSKEPIVLEKLLTTVKGYVQGWQLEDKETVVGFLQKLMFSAGIIKAVFFRGKGQQKELQREMNSMANDERAQEAKFEAFIREINDPNSRFNRDSLDKPEMRDETPPDSNRGTR